MSTDWENEDFRKLYEHPPPEFERLPFEARCLAAEILRRCDRRGRVIPGSEFSQNLIQDFAFHVRAHTGEVAFLERALAALMSDDPDPERCYLVFRDGYLTVRNFSKAQRSESAIRMARKRQRDACTGGVESGFEDGDACDDKTSRDAPSGLVWSGLISESEDRKKFSEGKDLTGTEKSAKTGPYKSDEEREVFEYWAAKLWPLAHKHGRVPRATASRLSRIRARLREGYSVADLKRVVDAVAESKWHLGENPNGIFYIEFETIFQNAETVDGWLTKRAGKAPGLVEHEKNLSEADAHLLEAIKNGHHDKRSQELARAGKLNLARWKEWKREQNAKAIGKNGATG
jgi:uncharacterized phage protein (TIGR02220 family)